jgi:hypothetical protein
MLHCLRIGAAPLASRECVFKNCCLPQPSNLPALRLRAEAYYLMNEHDVAKRHYGECLRFDPDDAKCKMLFRQALQLHILPLSLSNCAPTSALLNFSCVTETHRAAQRPAHAIRYRRHCSLL